MTSLQPVTSNGLIYDHIVGTGGIGSGIFFSLTGDHTLGRNESRMGTLQPYKDFCKQHIILHYISVLLGAKPHGAFQSFPIGKLGNDDIGKKLLQDIKAAGMVTDHIGISKNLSTLFSVCFQYPDHAGGNITTENSASGDVSPEDIERCFRQLTLSGDREIILAAPEVPLAARMKLLELGRQRGSFNTASVLSSEVEAFRQLSGFALVDLLSVNIDEARHIANIKEENVPVDTIIDACVQTLTDSNAKISILITNGAKGSYCYSRGYMEHTPALSAPVISTAGAGDAFLAGTIAGICCGLPLIKENSDHHFSESPLRSAVELGTLLASLSVTSCDTIHAGANAAVLHNFAKDRRLPFSELFSKLFKE